MVSGAIVNFGRLETQYRFKPEAQRPVGMPKGLSVGNDLRRPCLGRVL